MSKLIAFAGWMSSAAVFLFVTAAVSQTVELLALSIAVAGLTIGLTVVRVLRG